jgi:HPt (histidine-containing phosphotransfer) domain-containing protein
MFLANGFNGFIAKPIVMQEMDEILKKWLSSEKTTRRSEAGLGADNEAYDSFLDDVGKICEINTEIGLSRFSGMKDLYRNTLNMFYEKLVPECNKMALSLDAKDLKSFSISAHAMKSMLGIIGARGLSEMAFALEAVAKSLEIDCCEELFPVFLEKLLSLHKQLSVIFHETEVLLEKEPGNIDHLRENVSKALEAAENFDNDEGIKIIKNLLSFDFGCQINALLGNVMAAFEDYNYDEATEILKQI